MSLVDEISPAKYGSDLIRLRLANASQRLQAFAPIIIAVDYSRCLPEGVILPLEFTVTAPSRASNERRVFRRTTFRRFAPAELAFVPREGGSFLVRLAESFHNLYFGALVLDIVGDRMSL